MARIIFPIGSERFTSKKKAIYRRNVLADEVSEAKKRGIPINLKFRVLKKGSRFVVTKESKRRAK